MVVFLKNILLWIFSEVIWVSYSFYSFHWYSYFSKIQLHTPYNHIRLMYLLSRVKCALPGPLKAAGLLLVHSIAMLCRWLLCLWDTVLKGLGPKNNRHGTVLLFPRPPPSILCKIPTVDWLFDWFLILEKVNSNLEICSTNIIHSVSPRWN